MTRKGILLYSGGLDSLLAAKLLLDQGIDLIGLHFILPFTAPDSNPDELRPSAFARTIGLPLIHRRCDREYMQIVRSPAHGHGKHINPCIDCKIFFLKKAAEAMRAEGAAFVATGEVIGQRPMSQMKNTLRLIEKESGLEGMLLRPLSARLLKPTKAEIEGIVDREKLLGITGRGRKSQMALAEQFGIRDYSPPAGGCLLTDRFIAQRVRDLLDHHERCSMSDVYLLTIGRHFRLNETTKFIVSRNEAETTELEKYLSGADYFFIPEFKGPAALVLGPLGEDDLAAIAGTLARYGKTDIGDPFITIYSHGEKLRTIPAPVPADERVIDTMRI